MEQLKILETDMYLVGYSKSTCKAYLEMNKKFLAFIKKSAREVRQKDIESYLLHRIKEGISPRTLHLIVAALKYYYCILLKRRFQLKYPKTPKSIPYVLSQKEISQIIDSIDNPKHRLLIELLYGSGLRVGEAVKIKIEDMDLDQKILLIKGGKGNKDRMVIIGDLFIFEVKRYLRSRFDENPYVFHTRNGHITIRTAQLILKNAAKKMGLSKRVFCHALRASFATHLIEQETSIHHVQKLLGHNHIRTTLGYIKSRRDDIQKIKSPLDSLQYRN
jgi:site-specific recombinase XerD